MTFTISIYDLVSWLITIVSVMLFIFERKKNNRLPYYMAIQGILRACKVKAGFYSSRRSELIKRNNGKNSTISMDEYISFTEGVYSDFASLMEHIMGSLKAIEPGKDMPFDTSAFTNRQNVTSAETDKEIKSSKFD